MSSSNSESDSLKQVIVPVTLMAKFQSLAEPNTAIDTETCGFLTGKVDGNNYKITHMIIPKQSGTANTCATTHEEEMLEYMEENHLITLGSIHTHPSQKVFLSAIDLHMQFSLQVMLPEAISIVVSPRHIPGSGIFSLTRDHGMNVIKNCRETGFHPHPNPKGLPIYAKASHVMIIDSDDVTIKDFRFNHTD
jgi:STAM-binding protein